MLLSRHGSRDARAVLSPAQLQELQKLQEGTFCGSSPPRGDWGPDRAKSWIFFSCLLLDAIVETKETAAFMCSGW